MMTTQATKSLVQLRWHGRGGQGVVTASVLLVQAALRDGKYFQAFPEYGAERSGAPLLAYTRISDEPVHQRSQVETPDVVVVLDATLIGRVDFQVGLGPDGVVVVNTTASPQELRTTLGRHQGRVCCVDATRIATECLGRNIPNVPTIGALLRADQVVSPEALEGAIQELLGSKFSKKTVQANLEAFQRGFQEAAVA